MNSYDGMRAQCTQLILSVDVDFALFSSGMYLQPPLYDLHLQNTPLQLSIMLLNNSLAKKTIGNDFKSF